MIITKLDGTVINTDDYGIKVTDFVVSSPLPRNETEEIDGRHGFIDLGTTYDGRDINVSFVMKAYDSLDFTLLRNDVFKALDSRQPFYITDKREPGKRWLVKVDRTYAIDQIRAFGRTSITFKSTSPFAESLGTTLDPLTFEAETWQIGQGIESEQYGYAFNTNTFEAYNAGDVAVNPRELPIKIVYKGASDNLTITNVTNGDSWIYNGTTTSDDVIEINGIRSFKNNESIFRDTNKRLITLEKGWNEFNISGTSGSFDITFDFRFYYL